jgi:hypothetical protein
MKRQHASLCTAIGLVGARMADRWWLILIGVFVTGIGLARLAPTQARIRAEQVALNTTGCHRDLTTALTILPPRPPRTR